VTDEYWLVLLLAEFADDGEIADEHDAGVRARFPEIPPGREALIRWLGEQRAWRAEEQEALRRSLRWRATAPSALPPHEEKILAELRTELRMREALGRPTAIARPAAGARRPRGRRRSRVSTNARSRSPGRPADDDDLADRRAVAA
jgi:hypothetical protein